MSKNFCPSLYIYCYSANWEIYLGEDLPEPHNQGHHTEN